MSGKGIGYIPNVVYVGLQKTGSTYLRNYFYNHCSIHCTRNGVFFQTEAADIALHGVEGVRARYESLFAEDPGKPCRIDMYEAIGMGYVFRGISAWDARHFVAPGKRLNQEHIFTAPEVVVARIKAALPSAKIIITIRNQVAWFDSNYRHFFEQLPKGKESILDFFSTPEGKVVLDVAMFDRLVELYDREFGRAAVLVLPLERLESEEEAALSELCTFLGVERMGYKESDKRVNRGRRLETLLTNRRARAASNLVGRLFDRPSKGFISEQQVLACLGPVYAASNARLSSRIDIDLSTLGYPA